MNLKVILPADLIPADSMVRKQNGTTQYRLMKEISVHMVDGKPITIPGKGASFLVGEYGPINAISNDTELVWLTDSDSLYQLISDKDFYENYFG